MHRIAIFGGAFDPIHNGHLQTSLKIQNYFNFDSYIFLPCKIPALKAPALANNSQRIKMIDLAINQYTHFKLDLREILRDTPSYMVNTLESFRLEFPNTSITLVIGYDAFISLPHWHQWKKLITLANILVINRNEFVSQSIPSVLNAFLQKYQIKNKDALLGKQAGSIFLFDAGNYEISSTKIREEIKKGNDVTHKLPSEVYRYIRDERLYQ